ncbi:hypothetical protein DFH28DRAFT_899884 [Melampsora americana]|nr:hypothetical protein DFH28DRAFT_899884 [Melampsora americana]
MDSGTEEDDEELRHLIQSVQDEEEVSPVLFPVSYFLSDSYQDLVLLLWPTQTGRPLRLAGQEEREVVKGRTLLVEAVREQFANKAVQDLDPSVGKGDEVARSTTSSRKAKRSASTQANTSSEELSALTGELGWWNEVSLAAHSEQHSRINELYERELGIAHARNKNKRMMAQSLAAHRTAKLALQHQRSEFEKAQVTTLKTPLDNASTQKLDAFKVKMGSMNDGLAIIMQHLVTLVPPTTTSSTDS